MASTYALPRGLVEAALPLSATVQAPAPGADGPRDAHCRPAASQPRRATPGSGGIAQTIAARTAPADDRAAVGPPGGQG